LNQFQLTKKNQRLELNTKRSQPIKVLTKVQLIREQLIKALNLRFKKKLMRRK